MILLDAYALHAFVQNESAAGDVEELIRTGDTAIVATNLSEVVEGLVRKEGWDEGDVVPRLGTVVGHIIAIRPVTEAHAWRAGLLRSRHYRQRDCNVSLADCVLVAAAERGDSVATADRGVATVARAEGIELVALPDSSGTRP